MLTSDAVTNDFPRKEKKSWGKTSGIRLSRLEGRPLDQAWSMSFVCENSVVLPYSLKDCWSCMSDTEKMRELLLYNDITHSCEILTTDSVSVKDDCQIEEYTDTMDDEECTRVHFNLVERVEYLGISKDIEVTGYLVYAPKRFLHIDHRSASNGLVVTDKVRYFREVPGEEDLGTEDNETTPPTPSDEQVESEQAFTEVREVVQGTTTWYLKYFVEAEARRSHKAAMDRYEAFLEEKI